MPSSVDAAIQKALTKKPSASSSQKSSSAPAVNKVDQSIQKALAKLNNTPAAGQAAGVATHHEAWWQKALNVANLPQRVLVSAANELGQGINSVLSPGHDSNDPRYHASFGDFVQNIGNYQGKHRGIGVGDIIEEAHPNLNPWIKRGLGFAGDIATDPLTYLAPEEHLTKLGRLGTASKIAEAGHAAEGLGEAARAERLFADAAAVGSKGIAHASDEGLHAIGAHGGVMFNVPGTGRLARGVRKAVGMEPGELKQLQLISRESGTGRGLSRIAQGFDSALAKSKRLSQAAGVGGRLGEAERAAYRADIASGDPTKIYAATKGLQSADLKTVMEEGFGEPFARTMNNIFHEGTHKGVNLEDLSHSLAGDAGAATRVEAKAPGLVAKSQSLFEDARQALNKVAGYEVIKKAEHYNPRQLSDIFGEMIGTQSRGGGVGLAAFEKARTLKPGADFIVDGEKLGKFVEPAMHREGLTIEQQATDMVRRAAESDKFPKLKAALAQAGVDAHFFNPDPLEAWPRYFSALSKRAGRAAQEKFLESKGLIASRGVQVDAMAVAKEKLTKALALKGTTGAERQAAASAVEEARQAVLAAHEVLNGAHVAGEAHVLGAQQAIDEVVNKLKLPVDEVEAMHQYALEHFDAPLEALQHEQQTVARSLDEAQAHLTSSYENLDEMAKSYRQTVAKQDFLNSEIGRVQGGVEQAAAQGLPTVAASKKLTHFEQLREDVGHAITTTSNDVQEAMAIADANASRLAELQSAAIGEHDGVALKEQFLRQQADETYKAAAGYEAQVRAAQAADVHAAVADGQNAATATMVLNQVALGKVAEVESMLKDLKRLEKSAGTRAKKVENAVKDLEAKVRKLGKEIEKDPAKAKKFVETYRGTFQPLGFNKVAHPVIADAIVSASRMVKPEDVGGVMQVYDKVTNLWKAYALATPGFHFRNTFGGIWNNSLDGVEHGGYVTWFRANHAFINGTEDKLPALVREKFQMMRDAGFGLTGGQTRAEIVHTGQRSYNPLSPDFALLRANREGVKIAGQRALPGGEQVENMLRGTLALDRLLKGDTIEEAIGHVYKYHFNYSDLSQFERKYIKRIIPFYTWSRFNTPVQIEALIRQPAKFSHFMQLKNEVEAESPAPEFVPGYFLDQMSIRTPLQSGGGNVYVDPHLPFQDLSKFNSLESIVSNTNPILKIPTELTAGKQFFTGQPFKGTFKPVPGAWQKIPGFMKVASALGYAKKGADGSWMMKDRNLYAVETSFPLFGQTRRLLPSETKYQERALTSWLSFVLGAGIRSNTTADQKNEALNQLFQLQQLQAEQKSLGYLPTKAKASP